MKYVFNSLYPDAAGVVICLFAAAIPSVYAATANYQLGIADNHQASPTPTPKVETKPEMPRVDANMKERERLGRFGKNLPSNFQFPIDDVESRLFKEYGAVFVARGGVLPPYKIVFRDQAEVSAFQKSVESRTETVGGMQMMLQTAAMTALLSAINEASSQGLSITPRDIDSASRSYDDSVALWASRVEPALAYWIAEKKITAEDADRIRSLPSHQQVREVLRLEKHKIYFSKDLKKSILYSVAPPGSSQHLSMLAFDVSEYGDQRVCELLARHGWFQTVVSDLPHFTYLGVAESEMKALGLKKVKHDGRKFWIPDI